VALITWAEALFFQGKYATARSLAEEGLALSQEMGNRRRIASALYILGNIALYQGDTVTARTNYEESLAIWREAGNYRVIARMLCALGQLALYQGDSAKASSLLEESLAIYHTVSLQSGAAQALAGLGRVALNQGDFKTARARYGESLAICSTLGHKWHIAVCLDGLGYVSEAERNGVWAAQLWSAAQSLRETMDALLPPVERPLYERSVTAARAQLGEKSFAAAWTEGRSMTPEQALAAQGPVTIPTPASAEPPSTPPAKPIVTYPGGLTTREVEVLRLLARGLTDVQIAEQLVISPRTVNNHLTSIYSKIQVSSRAAATRYAIEHKLA